MVYFSQRHPLEDLLPARAPAQNADHLRIVPRPTLFSVLMAPGDDARITQLSATLQTLSTRSCGPSEWLLLSEDIGSEALGRSLTVAGVRWVDQTHAYVVAQLSGPNARGILAKGIAVDLHPDAFTVGQSANALCGQITVNLARVQEDAFELVVRRSYARFFFEDLLQAGREFGLSAAFGAV